MKLGVTGSQGFIGWHLLVRAGLAEKLDVVKATRETFADPASLEGFVATCDCVVHLAGVNRAPEPELRSANPRLARDLVQACDRAHATPHIVYASSTQVDTGGAYGESKLAAAELLAEWAEERGAGFTNVVIPNVFGEFGRPFYNSVVATFCHQLASGEEPQIVEDRPMELIHVQQLCGEFLGICRGGLTGMRRIHGETMTVSELLERLQEIRRYYGDLNELPDLSTHMTRDLLNTYRSFGSPASIRRRLELHADQRGTLFEVLRAQSGGQCFVSNTRPGVLRGEHFHLHKFESFFVIQGEARIRLRKVTTSQVDTLQVSGNAPTRVDIPTFHAHDIRNIGQTELVTLFWANEFYDPHSPDTYPMRVEGSSL